MRFGVVGGAGRLTETGLLDHIRAAGGKIAWHVPARTRNPKFFPCDVVLCATDYCGHPLYQSAKDYAEKNDITFSTVSVRWAKTKDTVMSILSNKLDPTKNVSTAPLGLGAWVKAAIISAEFGFTAHDLKVLRENKAIAFGYLPRGQNAGTDSVLLFYNKDPLVAQHQTWKAKRAAYELDSRSKYVPHTFQQYLLSTVRARSAQEQIEQVDQPAPVKTPADVPAHCDAPSDPAIDTTATAPTAVPAVRTTALFLQVNHGGVYHDLISLDSVDEAVAAIEADFSQRNAQSAEYRVVSVVGMLRAARTVTIQSVT